MPLKYTQGETEAEAEAKTGKSVWIRYRVWGNIGRLDRGMDAAAEDELNEPVVPVLFVHGGPGVGVNNY